MKQATLKDIAAECGVSLMTVSRALNPRYHNRMSAKTLERIQAVVKRLNYASDPAGRRLKRRKTDVITLVVDKRFLSPPAVMDFNSHFDDLSWGTIRGAIVTAHHYNYELKIEAIFSEDDLEQLIHRLQPQFTDGVIVVAGAANPPICDHLDSLKIPSIMAKYAESEPASGSFVRFDLEPARNEAYRYALASGRRKPAFLGSKRIYNCKTILQSIESFFSPRGMFNPELVFNMTDLYELRDTFGAFNGVPPFDILFCGNDTMADLAIRELRYNNIKVPEAVAVVGQDGNNVYTQPGRSNPATIASPWHDLTATCVSELIEIIEKESDKRVCKTILATFKKGETI